MQPSCSGLIVSALAAYTRSLRQYSGTHVNAEDENGRTPLDYALEDDEKGYKGRKSLIAALCFEPAPPEAAVSLMPEPSMLQTAAGL